MNKYKLAALSLVLAFATYAPMASADVSEVVIENDNVVDVRNDIVSRVNSGLNEAINNGLKAKIKTGDAVMDFEFDTRGNDTEIDVSNRGFGLADDDLNAVTDIINTNDGRVENIFDLEAETGQNIADDNGGVDEEHIFESETDETHLDTVSESDFVGNVSESHDLDTRTEDTLSEKINQEDRLVHVGETEIETGMAGISTKITTLLNSTVIKVDQD